MARTCCWASTAFAQTAPSEATGPSTEPLRLVREWKLDDPSAILAWSPKKPWLATLRRHGSIQVSDTQRWEVVTELRGPDSERGAITFSPNGKWRFALPAMALMMRRSPDGKHFAISHEDAKVRIYAID